MRVTFHERFSFYFQTDHVHSASIIRTHPSLSSKSVASSRTVLTKLLTPDHLTSSGVASGGVIMSWIDIAAGLTSFRHCGRGAVTASMVFIPRINY